ncbi:MAG TPA: nuclear transport factor 2 family protein [Usitatibacter sp.]|nr:nuclear transport factor 2 family protein [Usitatibacter sp.]
MHPYEERIREFYARFAARDAEGMARCYHPEIFFSDPVFPHLRGAQAADMWRMLLERATDLEVTLEALHADEEGVRAHWTARYTFSRTGRPVVNRVHSLFALREGLIVRQVDHFSFWRWAGQAFGAFGMAAGWFAPFKWKVRKDAATALAKFRARRSLDP